MVLYQGSYLLHAPRIFQRATGENIINGEPESFKELEPVRNQKDGGSQEGNEGGNGPWSEKY